MFEFDMVIVTEFERDVSADTEGVAGAFFAFAGDLTGDDGTEVAGEDEALFFALLALAVVPLSNFKASV